MFKGINKISDYCDIRLHDTQNCREGNYLEITRKTLLNLVLLF